MIPWILLFGGAALVALTLRQSKPEAAPAAATTASASGDDDEETTFQPGVGTVPKAPATTPPPVATLPPESVFQDVLGAALPALGAIPALWTTPTSSPPSPTTPVVIPDGVLLDKFGTSSNPKPGPRKVGYRSNPAFQWRYVVKDTDSGPAAVAAKHTGDPNRYVELIDANPDVPTVGNRASPFSTNFNFKRFIAGDRLNIPKSWNVFIDQDGTTRPGNPWPVEA